MNLLKCDVCGRIKDPPSAMECRRSTAEIAVSWDGSTVTFGIWDLCEECADWIEECIRERRKTLGGTPNEPTEA